MADYLLILVYGEGSADKGDQIGASGVSVFNKLYTKITNFECYRFRARYSAHEQLGLHCLGQEKRKKAGRQTRFFCLGRSMFSHLEVLERFFACFVIKTKKNPAKPKDFTGFWSECNYRTWKSPDISMVLAQ